MTDKLSFQHLEQWIAEFKAVNRSKVHYVVALTKDDAPQSDNVRIREDEVVSFCKSIVAPWFVVSSLSGKDVQHLFDSLFQRCLGMS